MPLGTNFRNGPVNESNKKVEMLTVKLILLHVVLTIWVTTMQDEVQDEGNELSRLRRSHLREIFFNWIHMLRHEAKSWFAERSTILCFRIISSFQNLPGTTETMQYDLQINYSKIPGLKNLKVRMMTIVEAKVYTWMQNSNRLKHTFLRF